MTPEKAAERVLVIPAAAFDAAGRFAGLRRADGDYARRVLDPPRFQFLPRGTAEFDERFLQLIPYVILRSGDRVFRYERGAAGGESRLAALASIGLGGHVSEADAAGGDAYRVGLARELAEEVRIDAPYTERLIGFLHDDGSAVGRVHLGVAHVFDLEAPNAVALEPGLERAGFVTIDELRARRPTLERWSQWVLDELN